MNYFDNLSDTLIAANSKALAYGDGKAWDNRKGKIRDRHSPRGKAYRKMEDMHWKSSTDKLYAHIDSLLASGVPTELIQHTSV